ncbi:hypothetical protein ETAA8_59040 [Anatilimnocola aggregata]|uniref:Uncharacterized protein n=1 Tax=Anatilimnocola aggregata TaxID=2528021 RepID=A0A517YKL3_9BACT|nr:hypothetical protein [Anatilimnocola aggregata]QDU30756.1 hypothetical protein ETAA8_59040 [Anatilimnocola aggregata]
METKPNWRELLDACRIDQNDPQRPELAAELAPLARELPTQPDLVEALNRSQQFDRNVRSALEDVPIPASLAERLLAGCDAHMVAPADAPTVPTAPEPVFTSTAWSRRKALTVLATAASLLVLLLGGIGTALRLNKPQHVTNDELALRATQWFNHCGPAAKWLPGSQAPLKQFPLDRAIVVRPSRWAQIDPQTVAYELVLPRTGQRALLFVHHNSLPHPQLRTYPSTRLNSSGGIMLGAWRRGEVIYVLSVVENGDQRLDDFIKSVPQA